MASANTPGAAARASAPYHRHMPVAQSPRRRAVVGRSLATTAAAGAVLIGVRALAQRRPRHDDRGLIDWGQVRAVARSRTGEAGGGRADAAALGARYDADAAELAPLMGAICQSTPAGFPRFTVVDRGGFVDINVRIVQRLLVPVETLRAQLPDTGATAVSRALMSRYLGEMFGFVAKRVLGQYDPVLRLSEPMIDEPPSLYLVESNIETFERRTGVPGDALRRYLILHELTHAWQFESHPWLRDHLARLVREALLTGLVEQLDTRHGRPHGRGGVAMVRSVPRHVRTQARALGRIEAVMSVLEGYGNFVMHRVGREHLPCFDELERAFHQRATQRSIFERVVLAVTGMSMKLRQYDLGERFCGAVTQHEGLDLLNRVWEAPEFMPTLAELRSPDLWMARVR